MRQYKLQTILRDEHWKPFHRLLEDRRTSVDQAYVWLVKYGYTVSRSTVGLYAQRYLNRSLNGVRAALGGTSDRQLRLMLNRRAKLLAGAELVALATFGELLASAGAEPGGRKTVPAGSNRRRLKGR